MWKTAAIAATVSLLLSVSAQSAPLLKTHVAEGELAGKAAGSVSAYLGVPFAAPPVGDLRWRAPELARPWTGVRQATEFAASCMQGLIPDGFGPWTHEYMVTGKVSEDCLYLNVWTPAKKTGKALPVMVWIHGGGFTGGSGSVPVYDGAALAAKGIVVVSINYRLGVFGFMAHPELTAESPNHASGNYGLMDQVAALKWLKANAAAFGGDPNRITIAGQSAGAMSVVNLTLSPLAKGLFSAAIPQSGVGFGFGMQRLPAAEKIGLEFAKVVGAADLKALRALPAETILNAKMPESGPNIRFSPIVDSYFIPDQPEKLLAEGRFNDTPMLTGNTADEASGMNPKYNSYTYEECYMAVGQMFGQMAPQFAAAYLGKPGQPCNPGMKKLFTDRGAMARWQWVDTRLKTGKAPIYVYLFTHVEAGTDPDRYGSFHTVEVPYVFHTLDASPERPFTAKDREIAKQTSDIWVAFVKNHDPNVAGLPNWPKAGPDRLQMNLGDEFRAAPVLDPEKTKLMQEYLKKGGTPSMF